MNRLGLRSVVVLAVASIASLMMFAWPLLVQVDPASTRLDPPFIVLALLPIAMLAVVAELSEDGIDSKALAMLGVLIAINAGLRTLGAGIAGIDTVFFLLVLAGRVFGSAFGYVLGCLSLFASALLTSGVGPWLPFQMMAAAWIGLGAGLLLRRPQGGKAEILMLCGYGALGAYVYGLLMNLSSWPFLAGFDPETYDGSLAFVPGDDLGSNLHRFFIFSLVTSTAGWDTGRAITTVLAIAMLGPTVLATLRRAARKGRWQDSQTATSGCNSPTVG